MKKEGNIAVADDEESIRKLFTYHLSDNFNVVCFKHGADCWSKINKLKADIFLLDIRMPGGVDGIELCKRIRQHPSHKDSFVVFLSAMDSLDQKIKGYEAGADDYITKPIEFEEISVKVNQLYKRYQKTLKDSQEALSLAMTAMANGSEMGEINHFFEKLPSVSSYEGLCHHIIHTARNFGLDAIIQIRTKDNNYQDSTSGFVNQLEENLMLQAIGSDRIISFGHRCLFNFSSASLLVRKMPTDEDKAGRFRDHLASVMNGVEEKVRSLKTDIILADKDKQTVFEALHNTHEAFDGIMEVFKKREAKILNIIENMLDDMNLAFSYLDLEEEDEQYLTKVTDESIRKITVLFAQGVELDREFEKALECFDTLLSTIKVQSSNG